MIARLKYTFLLAAVGLSAAAYAGSLVNPELPWHPAVLDQAGKLLAWHNPEKNLGYDHVLHLGWDFIEHKVPSTSGLKVYLINSSFDGRTLQGRNGMHNPAMLFASFVDSVAGWYPYSGDEEAISVVREMLDYQLAHGTTPTNWAWPGVPFSTSSGNQREYGHGVPDTPKGFYGGTETDKVGELGAAYVLFYEMTGAHKYLRAGIRCADALAKHVRVGDEDHTPWPFRVDARTGITLANAEFGGDVASSLRLFDELVRLKSGDVTAYRAARDLSWRWLRNHPLNPGSKAFYKWNGFYEDVTYHDDSVNQMLPTMTCFYILSRPDPAAVDPEWKTHVQGMLDWVRVRFGRGPFYGAWGIDEQSRADGHSCCSPAGLGSHTGRWAAMNAMYAERTGDARAREDAFRSLNYATYFASSNGIVSCCGVNYHNPYWFSDGYSDYLRNFNWAMGALPELAPVGENHLLKSSSVVQSVLYAPHRISYRTFDVEATEVLRLNFEPRRVVCGGLEIHRREDVKAEGFSVEPLAGGDFIARIHHTRASDILIEGFTGTPQHARL